MSIGIKRHWLCNQVRIQLSVYRRCTWSIWGHSTFDLNKPVQQSNNHTVVQGIMQSSTIVKVLDSGPAFWNYWPAKAPRKSSSAKELKGKVPDGEELLTTRGASTNFHRNRATILLSLTHGLSVYQHNQYLCGFPTFDGI